MTDKKTKKVDDKVCILDNSEKIYEETKEVDTDTDVYYKTECKLEGSKVAIPTFDSVIEAKVWVDDENKR